MNFFSEKNLKTVHFDIFVDTFGFYQTGTMALTPKGKELKDLDLDDLLSKLTDAELEELQSELIDPDVRAMLLCLSSHCGTNVKGGIWVLNACTQNFANDDYFKLIAVVAGSQCNNAQLFGTQEAVGCVTDQ